MRVLLCVATAQALTLPSLTSQRTAGPPALTRLEQLQASLSQGFATTAAVGGRNAIWSSCTARTTRPHPCDGHELCVLHGRMSRSESIRERKQRVGSTAPRFRNRQLCPRNFIAAQHVLGRLLEPLLEFRCVAWLHPHRRRHLIRAARLQCRHELGQATFDEVYAYLRNCAADDSESDEQMRTDLLRIMGESKLRWWPLVDQLLFLDDVGADGEAGGSPIGVF